MTTRSPSITVKPHHIGGTAEGSTHDAALDKARGRHPPLHMETGYLDGTAFPPGMQQRGLRRQGIRHTPGHEKLRREENRQYTTSPDPTAAISRAATDGLEPGLSLATAIIEVGNRLRLRSNTVNIRWAPAHKEVEGNEVADDDWAKEAAENSAGAIGLPHPRETSLAHRTRVTTKAKSQGKSWIEKHAWRRRGYKPPKGNKLRAASDGWKALASRYYHELLSGQAATGAYLRNRMGKVPSDKCW